MWKSIGRWFKKRGREGSTWAGLGAIGAAVTMTTGINEAAQVGEVVAGAGQEIATGNYIGGGLGMLGGILAIFLKDKLQD